MKTYEVSLGFYSPIGPTVRKVEKFDTAQEAKYFLLLNISEENFDFYELRIVNYN